MKLVLATLMALNLGLYELPRVEHTSGVAGAKQAAHDVEIYLGRVREAVEDAHIAGNISVEGWDEYLFLDEHAMHYQHLFVMSVLFYEEAPVEDPYGLMVTKSAEQMIRRIMLVQRLLLREGVEIPEPEEKLFVSSH